MNGHKREKRRGIRRIATLGAVAIAGSFLSILTATSAHAAGASIQIDTPGRLGTGQTIQVSGNAGTADAPTLYVAVCEGTPTASNCDQSLSGFGSATAHIQSVTPDPVTGAWSTSFFLRTTITTGHTPSPGFNCITAGTCIIGTTNSANPADHTYDATVPLAGLLGPAVTLSAGNGVDGDTVSISGSGFPVADTTTGAAITQSVNVGLCGFPPTSTSCDGALGDYAQATVTNGVLPATNVTLHFPFTDFGSTTHDCTAANTCIVGTSNATNQADQTFTTGAFIQNIPAATLTVGSISGQTVTTAARAGNVISLSGANWDAAGAITGELCDTSGSTCDASGLTASTLVTDGSGNLTGAVTVDASATTGARTLKVSQGTHVESAAMTILGTPTLSGVPTGGGTGTTVNLTGSNWNPGSSVTLRGTDGTSNTSDVAGSATANATGSFTATYTVNDAATTEIDATSGSLSAVQPFAFSGNDCTVPDGGNCSVQQNITFTANPGHLTQSQSGGTVELGSFELDGTDQHLTGSIKQDTVTDARGTSAGWLLSAKLSDLANGATPTANGTIPATNMAWLPACATTSGTATVTPGTSTNLSNSDQTLCTVASGQGNGVFTADSTLDLLVPATADSGTYNGVLTLTLS